MAKATAKAKGGKVGKQFPIESKKSNSGKAKLTGKGK